MKLTVELKDDVDFSLIQKVLLQIKGIINVEIADSNFQTIENADGFSKVMEQSEDDYKKGRVLDLDDDLLDELFNPK